MVQRLFNCWTHSGILTHHKQAAVTEHQTHLEAEQLLDASSGTLCPVDVVAEQVGDRLPVPLPQ
jgi:hypothetical protein